MKEIKWGQKISLGELEKKGWKQVDCFGGDFILKKGRKRILFNPKEERIDFIYEINS